MPSSWREVLESRLRARPSDWPAWLVYADWLLEQGDARGELIVLKHRLLTTALSSSQREALQQQIDQLERDGQEQGLQGWSRSFAGARWRHGFLLAVTLPANPEGIASLESLVLQPAGRLLSEVTFAPIHTGPGSERPSPLGPEGAQRLARSWALSGLLRLDLDHQRIGSDGAVALAHSPHLGGLVRLALARNGLGDEGALALAGSCCLPSLTVLDLADNDIRSTGWAALRARWPSLAERGSGAPIGAATLRVSDIQYLIDRINLLYSGFLSITVTAARCEGHRLSAEVEMTYVAYNPICCTSCLQNIWFLDRLDELARDLQALLGSEQAPELHIRVHHRFEPGYRFGPTPMETGGDEENPYLEYREDYTDEHHYPRR